jgi:uncharacterized membrane protein (DUF106 family)
LNGNTGIHAGRKGVMTIEDRRLMVETISEIKQLKGEMKEFKEHVIGRVKKLEKKEGERSKERISVVAVLISGMALAVSIIVNFFKRG